MTERHARLLRRSDRRAARRWYDAAVAGRTDDPDRAALLWDQAETLTERIGLCTAGRRDLLPIARRTPATAEIAATALRAAAYD
jgi:hypothetical protein